MSPVAFDATLWDEPITGIGLYTRELYRALGETGLEVQRWGARHSGEAPRGHLSRTGWTLGHLPQWLQARGPSLYHAVSNFNLPLQRTRGVPYVLTVHDLVPLLLPETVSARLPLAVPAVAGPQPRGRAAGDLRERGRRAASVLERFSVDPAQAARRPPRGRSRRAGGAPRPPPR